MSRGKLGVKPAVVALRTRIQNLSKKAKWILGIVLAGVVVAIAGTVYAISNTSPDPAPGSQGPNAFLVIGRVGGGNTLPSSEANVKLVYEQPPTFVDVFDGPWCDQASQYGDRRADPANNPCDNPDPTTNVIFDFQAIDNNTGAPVGPKYTVNSWQMAAGGGVGADFRINLSGKVSAVQSTDGRYFVLVKAHWETQNPSSCTKDDTVADGCLTGSDFFKITIPNAAAGTNYVTYAVTNTSSEPLTVETAGPGVVRTDESDITFEFGPPCSASNAARLQPLKWEDADYGETNELGDNIGWDLFEIAPDGTSTKVMSQFGPSVGGQDAKVQSSPYQFKDGYKYRWTWRNVDSSNGVQVYLPFDSYNYIRNCSTVGITKTNDARPNQAVGEPFDYFLQINHSGPDIANLTINDNLPSGLAYVPDTAFNIPPPTSTAGPISWTFNAGSPELNTLNSTGTFTIKFKVQATSAGTYSNTATGSAVDVNGIPVNVNPSTSTTTVIAIDLTNKPFFQIKGGDIAVGAGMDLGTNLCTQPSGYPQHDQASIVGWNLGSGNNYDGAGTQQGAFALNHLQAFVTGQGSANAPGGLSFANTGSPDPYAAGGEIYGGKFGSLPCIPDYAKDNTNTSPGSKKLSELLGIAGPNYDLVNGSAPKVIYVPSGDVLVDVNVRYSGTYNNVNDIPSFALILGGGNMYIDPSVSQLDGFYSARPSNSTATNGIIYTCAPSGFGTNAANVLTQNLSASCGNKLVFNGAVSARQIWLLRTFGSLANGQPAEIFNYVPELWMRSPFSTNGSSGAVEGYDAITSLPPNL